MQSSAPRIVHALGYENDTVCNPEPFSVSGVSTWLGKCSWCISRHKIFIAMCFFSEEINSVSLLAVREIWKTGSSKGIPTSIYQFFIKTALRSFCGNIRIHLLILIFPKFLQFIICGIIEKNGKSTISINFELCLPWIYRQNFFLFDTISELLHYNMLSMKIQARNNVNLIKNSDFLN